MRPLAARVESFTTTIFSEMSALARAHGAVNLGQGFPDFPGPDWVKEAARAAIAADVNQYALGTGATAVRQALAARMSPRLGRAVDPEREIVVTSGCTEAIVDAVLGLVDPGDEVVLFEPFYDSYYPAVIMAGGIPRCVPLRAPDERHSSWWLDADELAAAFGPATRLVLLNTPHNPTGKVFTRAELEPIAALCRQWDCLLFSDEVYEEIVFDGHTHLSPAVLPGMWERTLTASSSGKTFSLTGWKVGWVVGPAALCEAVRRTHQFVTFCSAAPMQAGIAAGLAEAEARGYYAELRAAYRARRDLLVAAVQDAGLHAYAPEGAYFVLCDFSGLPQASAMDDTQFARWLTTVAGVAAIPPSYFYSDAHKGLARHLTRFCFCKQEETLRAAAERLHRVRGL
jgi:N-succinyldiaminopimelate aminotransferase